MAPASLPSGRVLVAIEAIIAIASNAAAKDIAPAASRRCCAGVDHGHARTATPAAGRCEANVLHASGACTLSAQQAGARPGSRSSVSESVLKQDSFNFKLNSGPKPASRPGSRTSNRLSASNLQVDRLGFAPAAKRTSRCAVSEAWGELGRLDDAACLRVMAAPSAACNVRVACDNDLLRDSELRALPPAGKAEDQTVAAAAAKRA